MESNSDESSEKQEASLSPRWWWDPPKLVPIIISLVALIVSGLSWWEGRQVRRINEEINRPILALSILETSVSPPSTFSTKPFAFLRETAVIAFKIKLSNTGKTTAHMQGFNVDKSLPVFDFKPCKKSIIEEINVWDMLQYPKEVLPGEEKTFWTRAKVNTDCNELSVQVFVDITYVDNASGREYNQYFKEIINASLAELEEKK